MLKNLINEFNTFHTSIACMFDIWTGHMNYGYILVNVYYVNSTWHLKKKVDSILKIFLSILCASHLQHY